MKPINSVVAPQARLSRTLVHHWCPVRGKCSHLSAFPQEELRNIVPLEWSSSHILVLSGSLSVSLRRGAFGDHHPSRQLVTVSASLWLSSTDGQHNSGKEPGSSEFPKYLCAPHARHPVSDHLNAYPKTSPCPLVSLPASPCSDGCVVCLFSS